MENSIEQDEHIEPLETFDDDTENAWDDLMEGEDMPTPKSIPLTIAPDSQNVAPESKTIRDYLDEKAPVKAKGEFVIATPPSSKLIKPTSSNTFNIRALQERYSMLMMNGKTRVVAKNHRGGIELIEVRSFHDFYRYLKENIVINKQGNTRPEYASYKFMEDAGTRRYLGLTFNPKNDQPPSIWNLWEGWRVQPKEGDVELALELIRSLCNYNDEHIEYFLDWLAHMVQKPWELPETAIVLRGEQGIGKGTLMKMLSRIVFHYLHLSSSRPLVGSFNGILATAFLVFCDESIWGGSKDAEGTLKALITEGEHTINEKNEKEFMIENYKRFIFASNEDWAAPVGTKDRRYFVLDCSSKYKGQTGPNQFFDKVDRALKDDGLAEAFLHFLMNRDISKRNMRDAPKTKGYVELMTKSFDTTTRFICDLIGGVHDLSADTVFYHAEKSRWVRNKLYADMLAWCDLHAIRHKPSSTDLGKTLSKIFEFDRHKDGWRNSWKDRDRGYFYEVPDRTTAMVLFAKNVAGIGHDKITTIFPEYEPKQRFPNGKSESVKDKAFSS
ncbi:DUF5906 domain-containing protein [Burkholderia cepacia]|uniref:DUF5906 domain-containing protein n=1 Tax=Burkholderia cepacia TaxID=292 RepID=UPI0026E0438D|nr:DUF5906 domain-containing protein [Burkholderia cepacia]MDO5943365.1 DUF5906 domain-containing protein [Burkholderia cepacia]